MHIWLVWPSIWLMWMCLILKKCAELFEWRHIHLIVSGVSVITCRIHVSKFHDKSCEDVNSKAPFLFNAGHYSLTQLRHGPCAQIWFCSCSKTKHCCLCTPQDCSCSEAGLYSCAPYVTHRYDINQDIAFVQNQIFMFYDSRPLFWIRRWESWHTKWRTFWAVQATQITSETGRVQKNRKASIWN